MSLSFIGKYRELISDSFFSLFIKILGAILGFVLSVIISRKIGAEQLGFYYLSLSIVSIFAALASFGIHVALLKVIPNDKVNNNGSFINQLVISSVILVFLTSTTLLIISLTNLNIISAFFDSSPDFEYTLKVLLYAFPFMSVIVVMSHAIQAVGSVKVSMIFSGVLQNILIIPFIFLIDVNNSYELSFAYFSSVIFVVFFSFLYWRRNTNIVSKYYDFGRIKNDMSLLISNSFPIYMVLILTEVNTQIYQLMLGKFLTSEEVSYFGIASRFAVITSFIFVAVNRVFSPKLAESFAKGNKVELERQCQLATLLLVIGGVPIVLLLVFFSEQWISLFGDEFSPASGVLQILALAQGVNIITGPVGQLLHMTGKSDHLRNYVFFSLLITLSLGWYIIPLYGALGAAYSQLISVTIVNFLSLYAVRKHLNIKIYRYL